MSIVPVLPAQAAGARTPVFTFDPAAVHRWKLRLMPGTYLTNRNRSGRSLRVLAGALYHDEGLTVSANGLTVAAGPQEIYGGVIAFTAAAREHWAEAYPDRLWVYRIVNGPGSPALYYPVNSPEQAAWLIGRLADRDLTDPTITSSVFGLEILAGGERFDEWYDHQGDSIHAYQPDGSSAARSRPQVRHRCRAVND